jgi:hypothetical protein
MSDLIELMSALASWPDLHITAGNILFVAWVRTKR